MKKSIRSIVLASIVAIVSTGFAYASPTGTNPTPRPPVPTSTADAVRAFFGF